MKKLILILCISLISSPAFSAGEILTMVRDPTTYEYTLQVLNNPVVRSTIAGAAAVLPQAAAAVGVTVSAGVTLPLAAAVLGSSWIANDIYQKQMLKRDFYNPPQYVEMSPTAGGTDWISQPAHITTPVTTVTPETFPNSTEQLLGRPAWLSTPLGDFLETVKNDTSQSTADLRQMIASNSQPGSIDGIVSGDVVSTPYGNYQVQPPGWQGGWPVYQTNGNFAMTSKPNHFYTDEKKTAFNTETSLQRVQPSCPSTGWCWNGEMINLQWVNAAANKFPSPASMNWPALKTALQTYLQTNPDAVKDVLSKTRPEDIAATDKKPSSSDTLPRQQTGPISQQEINNWTTNNNQNIANYNTTNITNNSTVQDIAKAQMAQTAAQSQVKIPDTIVFTGNANLPPDNIYDPNITQPEENSFVDKVHAFINSGLPVLSSIKGSGLTASGSPSMSTTIWNHPVVVDFSDQQTVLRAAGSVLVIISLIVAYCIIVRS